MWMDALLRYSLGFCSCIFFFAFFINQDICIYCFRMGRDGLCGLKQKMSKNNLFFFRRIFLKACEHRRHCCRGKGARQRGFFKDGEQGTGTGRRQAEDPRPGSPHQGQELHVERGSVVDTGKLDPWQQKSSICETSVPLEPCVGTLSTQTSGTTFILHYI